MSVVNYRSSHHDTGDTIIEVLVAISILGLLVVVSYGMMTRGIGSAYNSLDRTNTQALMNGQSSVIRAIHADYVDEGVVVDPSGPAAANDPAWTKLIRYAVDSPSNTDTTNLTKQSDGCSTAVAVDKIIVVKNMSPQLYFASTGGVVLPDDLVRKSTVPTVGDGIWIEVYKARGAVSNAILPSVYDFYIKSCTEPIYGDGSTVLRQTKTVVRLYAQ